MKKIVVIFSVFVLSFGLTGCVEEPTSTTMELGLSETENTPQETDESEEFMVERVVYPHNEVIEVNIIISDDHYNELVQNAMEEEYVLCDITYNGYTLTNVAIRTKGNSSLRDVVQDGDDRFSYNIDVNYYQDQDLFGIDKLLLNNLYMDPTMMAEYLTYEALDSLNTVSSRTTFVALSINDEYYGLYLSVEQVGNEFLDYNYGNSDGELYKPEMGTGSNLSYIDENTTYDAFFDKLEDVDMSNDESVINFLQSVRTGDNLNEVFNIDSYLKYLAVSTYTVNLDSYQGGMSHNYYLYNNEGSFEWIAWDLNMSFNGFPMVNLSDDEAITFLIDEPTIGSVSGYSLIDTVLSNEDNLAIYHQYLQELLDGYFDYDTFEERVLEVQSLINEYVESDNNSFYSYTAFQNSIDTSSTTQYSLLDFVKERSENVQAQLDGTVPSTNNGEGNGSSNFQQPGQNPPGRR